MNRSGLTTRDRTARGPRRSGDRRAASVPSRPNGRRPRVTTRRGRAVRTAVGAALLGVALWLVLAGPVLAVSTVRVDGASTLTAEEVRDAAGIADGTPLLRVDVGAAEARVATLPQVASVEVARGWPRSVVVTVVERVPVAVVGDPGRRMLVDAHGVLFDSVSGAPPDGVVPLLVEDPGPGDPSTMAGLTAIRALPSGLAEQVMAVEVADPQHISMALLDGTLVEWGSAEQSATKGTALGALVDQIGTGTLEPAATIDVTAPGAVVLR